ncbi:hypothetical protein SLEP1_g45112 [Rubroshorea leprosula]|uniref:Uncharacterized protein n=1 Tax=Rubroshorea leprosula TaxID=152421 RepID=A0AAV5LI32_9ROSI|nr:hypothetical protein SLEP1_g45112 [Rubroshorea leprosula]
MEVQIISKENVKPASPTPEHLRFFKISLFDQLIIFPYASRIYFYPPTNVLDTHNKVEVLQKSLSKTLSHFYPLAGKIKDHLSIECNDEGAYFVQARINCRLQDFLTKPDLIFLRRFLPWDGVVSAEYPVEGIHVCNIQVTVFECGGIAIAMCLSHKFIDIVSNTTFLKAWTAAACGFAEAPRPNFIAYAPDFFIPARDSWLQDLRRMWGSFAKKGKCITRRFLFNATAVATLKSQATGEKIEVPTPVEAVSAFLWKCSMAASKARHGIQRPALCVHVVDLRGRIPLPAAQMENSVGNLFWIAAADCSEDCSDLHDLVGKLREAASKIDGDFLKKIRGEEGNSFNSEYFRGITELNSRDGNDCFYFVNWCKDLYGTDFGWGKPVWVSNVGMKGSDEVRNFCIVNETRSGDGVEAWLTLDEQVMAILERDPELPSLASLDLSPLAMD